MNKKFRVVFLDSAKTFLEELDEKSRNKILYNIWKSTDINDNELFKKLENEIWEFRTLYNKVYYRLFAFWDKTNSNDTVVITTHGIIKKTDKILKAEIEKSEKLRIQYFNEKSK
ncbi:MAG: type II toxin-antitoxin system RelE/ParE family toxin [Cytophagales bacterium]|nr:MAG: type II toxin-antitoxin system RelE/ParE family toxin [Cytophagales bacterium]